MHEIDQNRKFNFKNTNLVKPGHPISQKQSRVKYSSIHSQKLDIKKDNSNYHIDFKQYQDARNTINKSKGTLIMLNIYVL